MTPRSRRHLFLLGLALIVLSTLVWMQGCATFAPDYTWTRTRTASASIEWRKVSRDYMHIVCELTPEQAPNLGGCAFWNPDVCFVYSHLDEHAARRSMSGDGESLYDHEARHCAGWVHGRNKWWTK